MTSSEPNPDPGPSSGAGETTTWSLTPPHPEVLTCYEQLRGGVALIRFAERTQLELTGKDRQTFLHNLCTNEIKGLQPGTGCEAFITNVQGKCFSHGWVFCGPESLIYDSCGHQSSRLLPHLDKYLITEDVTVIDRSQEWCDCLLAGVEVPKWLTAQGIQPLPALLHHAAVTLAGRECWLRRVDMLGVHTYVLACRSTDVSQLIDQLAGTGLIVSSSDEAASGAYEMARMEHGFPLYGQDITEKNLPQEVDRNQQAISFNKGCYLGQETIARLDALGHVNRLLRAVRCPAGTRVHAGQPIEQDGRVVGSVTSAAYSPQLADGLLMAYLRTEAATSGTIANLGEGGPVVEVVPWPAADG